MYLLAIGCLIADRFPKAALISGNISLKQCKRAVRWANRYLEKPISVPVTMSVERLLARLQKADIPQEMLLEVFLGITRNDVDAQMGAGI